MKKTKIIVSLAVVSAITISGICALANDETLKERNCKPSFKMMHHFGKQPQMSEEMKAERKEKSKEMLSKMLEEGKITEEEYNKKLSEIESGEFKNRGFMGKGKMVKPGHRGENGNKNAERKKFEKIK